MDSGAIAQRESPLVKSASELLEQSHRLKAATNQLFEIFAPVLEQPTPRTSSKDSAPDPPTSQIEAMLADVRRQLGTAEANIKELVERCRV